MYTGLEGIVTDIPYTFRNGNDLYHYGSSTKREVGIYIEGMETLGVQSVYKYDGTTTYSDTLTLNIETGQTEVAGIDSVIDWKNVVNTEYFSLDGRKYDKPVKGLQLVRMTMTDGQTVTRKLIRK